MSLKDVLATARRMAEKDLEYYRKMMKPQSAKRNLTSKSLRPLRKYRQSKTPQEYLSQRVVEADDSDCILWTKGIDKDGYGQCRETRWGYELKVSRAHQLAYIAYVGPIPEGLLVCHHCDTPACVNPKHLFLGTNEDNMKDMVAKGRARNKWSYEASKRKKQRQELTEDSSTEDSTNLSELN